MDLVYDAEEGAEGYKMVVATKALTPVTQSLIINMNVVNTGLEDRVPLRLQQPPRRALYVPAAQCLHVCREQIGAFERWHGPFDVPTASNTLRVKYNVPAGKTNVTMAEEIASLLNGLPEINGKFEFFKNEDTAQEILFGFDMEKDYMQSDYMARGAGDPVQRAGDDLAFQMMPER